MKTLLLVVIIIGAAYSLPDKLRFDNHRVYSVNVDTKLQLYALQDLEATPNEVIYPSDIFFRKVI